MDNYPTAENLARKFYLIAHDLNIKVSAARVSETPRTWATYTPE
jgi:hypothetical protein